MKKLLSGITKAWTGLKKARSGLKERVSVIRAALALRLLCLFARVSSRRAEGFVDSAVKILIAVVIGALLLAGLYALFGNTIMPTLTQRIKDMFNYNG